LERLSRAYVQAFASMIGPDRDIPAPDVYTNAMVMGWMADEYSSLVGHPCPAVITGKPVALGGSLGRDDATARGGFYVLNHLSDELGIGSGARRVVVQGFGNAGVYIAELLHDAGWSIVALSDTGGAICSAQGLDPRAVLAAKRQGRSVVDFAVANASQVQAISPDEMLALDCELLVPAAYENLIHEGNVASIKARVVLDLANGPVTPEADAALEAAGVIVI